MASEKAPEKSGNQSGSKGSGQAALTPKQLAAQARAESEAADRRRERMIRIVGSLVVLAVVGGILAIGILSSRNKDQAAAPPTPDASAALPTGVPPDTYGVPYGAGWTAENAAALPTLELWEDFQCPACAQLEAAAGPQLEKLADDGLVKLLYRPTTFLDRNLAAPNAAAGNPNSSARATSAWGCAIDAGKSGEYHSLVFANQPAQEGEGFSDQALIDFGTQAGVSDTAAFTKCVEDGTYLAWSANSYQKFLDAGIGGTPAAYLNGVKVEATDLVDLEGLTKKIEAATAK